MRRRLAGLLLVAVAGVAHAADGAPAGTGAVAPPDAREAAKAVRAAFDARETEGVAALAARPSPDPWLVVDLLVGDRAVDVATAFAAATAGADAAALRAYVARRKEAPADDGAVRTALAAAEALVGKGAPPGDVLHALEPLDPPTDTVLRLRVGERKADALVAAGRPTDAITLLDRMAATAARIGWVRGEAAALRRGTAAALRAGDGAGALAHAERWLTLEETKGRKGGVADALVAVGEAAIALGDVGKARTSLERAVAVSEESGDRAARARALGPLADVHFRLGDYPRAVRLHREALQERRAAGDRVGAASSLARLAAVHANLGAWAKAFELAERSLEESKAVGDASSTAAALTLLGGFHGKLGRYDRAAAFQREALELYRKTGERAAALGALSDLGLVHLESGDEAEALKVFDEVVAEAERLGDPMLLAGGHRRRAAALAAAGKTEDAVAEYERAIAGYEAAKYRHGVAAVCVELAELHLRRNDLPAAQKLADRASREAERMRADALLASALTVRAGIRLASGNAAAAVEVARQGVSVVERLFTGLGAGQAAAARETVARLFEIGAHAAAQSDDPAALAYFMENGRAGALVETLGVRERLQRATVPDELRAEREAATRAEATAAAAYAEALRKDDLPATRKALATLDEARARSTDVAERIERESKRDESWDHRGATLEEIQGHLAPGQVFVALSLTEPLAVALVATPATSRVAVLAESKDVVEACEALHAADRDEDPTEALDRLRRLLVEPLALDPSTTTVLVSPEGPLCYVPFAALLRGTDVAVVPSGTTLVHLLEEARGAGSSVLALGDPDYAAVAGSGAAAVFVPNLRGGGGERASRLVPLPMTRVEAKAVGDVVLVGPEATEEGLRKSLSGRPEWRALHLACHGIVDRERPELSALALTPHGEDDGFLTAREVVATPVNADLVVLSACETGVGTVRRGEGLIGLVRAFLFAGSPRVVCSLWKVDDEATRALMTRFYEIWNPKDGSPGLPVAQALRAAQEHVRAQPRWRHPYYWAAWVLWGVP